MIYTIIIPITITYLLFRFFIKGMNYTSVTYPRSDVPEFSKVEGKLHRLLFIKDLEIHQIRLYNRFLFCLFTFLISWHLWLILL